MGASDQSHRRVVTIFICIMFMLPPSELALWSMVIIWALLAIYWFAYSRSHFKGPQKASEEDLRRIEDELERLAHATATTNSKSGEHCQFQR